MEMLKWQTPCDEEDHVIGWKAPEQPQSGPRVSTVENFLA